MLGRATDINLVVMNFNLESWGQERVEANNEIGMATKQIGHPTDDTWGVDTV